MVDTAKKEADEQVTKHKRARMQLQKLARDINDKHEAAEFKRIEKEMQLIELRETFKDVLYKLRSMAMENAEAAELIDSQVTGAGLKFPSGVSSARSSKSSSSGSSAGSRSSQRGELPWSASRRPLAGSIVNMDLDLVNV